MADIDPSTLAEGVDVLRGLIKRSSGSAFAAVSARGCCCIRLVARPRLGGFLVAAPRRNFPVRA